MSGQTQARDYILKFGKYKGDTLEEVYVTDRDYFDWMLENIESDDIQKKLKDTVNEMTHVKVYE